MLTISIRFLVISFPCLFFIHQSVLFPCVYNPTLLDLLCQIVPVTSCMLSSLVLSSVSFLCKSSLFFDFGFLACFTCLILPVFHVRVLAPFGWKYLLYWTLYLCITSLICPGFTFTSPDTVLFIYCYYGSPQICMSPRTAKTSLDITISMLSPPGADGKHTEGRSKFHQNNVVTYLGPHLSLWICLLLTPFLSCFGAYIYTLSNHGGPWFTPFLKKERICDAGTESVNCSEWEERGTWCYIVNIKINVNPLCTHMQLH